MRQKISTILLLSAIGLLSCRKSKVEPDIKQYDQTQIQNYIAAHGLTGMKRDLTSGDTTGIYYQILMPGDSVYNGTPLPPMDYPDKISFVFGLRTFDGKYVQEDTVANHFDDYLGHVASSANKLPVGLQLALHNILRYRGGSMRLLIPSHLAYGLSGFGSGSIQNLNTRISGNECLDYYVHVTGNIPTDNQATADDISIQKYMQANSLSGYTKTASGLYYKILTPGTGTDPITQTSTNTANYTGQLLNGSIFDAMYNGSTVLSFTLGDFATPGNVEGLGNYATAGTKISLIMPSALGYGEVTQSSIPPNSCLRFTWVILSVTP